MFDSKSAISSTKTFVIPALIALILFSFTEHNEGLSVSNNNAVPAKEESSKIALLIGVNYGGGLRGCHNDVKITKQYLIEHFKFQEENIVVIVDSDTAETQPSGDNIRLALSKLVEMAKPGDILFVHFSGHGDRKLSEAMDDDTGYDEYIIPADGNRITDDDFRQYVNQLTSKGCKITIMADCCSSGGMIEAAKEQIGKSTKGRCQHSRCSGFETINTPPPPEDNAYVGYRSLSPLFLPFTNPIFKFWKSLKPYRNLKHSCISLIYQTFSALKFWGTLKTLPQSNMEAMENYEPSTSSPPDGGILLSACQSYQTAQEREFSGTVYGVFTKAIETILKESGGVVTNRNLVLKAQEILDRQGIHQNPGLYCSDPLADALFLH